MTRMVAASVYGTSMNEPGWPMLDDATVTDAAEYLELGRVRWGCVVGDSPLTVRMEYVRRDGVVSRVEAFRPWRAVGWTMREQTPITKTCDRRVGTSSYDIAILSVPRPTNYFSSTIRQVVDIFSRKHIHVVTNQTHSMYAPWTNATVYNGNVVDVHVVGLSGVFGLKARSIAMYEYALSTSASSNVLVLEDDLEVSPHASALLQNAISELSNVEREYVLDCYVVSWQGHKTRRHLRHTFYEDDYGCCTQCMYFVGRVTWIMIDSMRRERAKTRPDPYDIVIHYTANASRVPILGTQRALVQHAGRVSTGLSGVSHLHQTNRFRR